MNRKILHPIWTNNAKTNVQCYFEYDTGIKVRANIATKLPNGDDNPDFALLLEQHSLTDIEQNTQRHIQGMNMERAQKEQMKKEESIKKLTEALYFTKHELFEIPEIANSTDKRMRARIRRSKTQTEAIAVAAALMMKEMSNAEPQGSTE